MPKHLTTITLFALTSPSLSSQASGTATLATIGGYAMTDFAVNNDMGDCSAITSVTFDPEYWVAFLCSNQTITVHQRCPGFSGFI